MAAKKKDFKKADLTKLDYKQIEKDLGKFWAKTQEYLKKAADESLTIAKKGEENIKVFSKKSKLTIEALILKGRQENFYNELGKTVVKTGSLGNKKVKALVNKINSLGKEIKSKTKKAQRT